MKSFLLANCLPHTLGSSEARPPSKQVCLPSRNLLEDLYFREAGRAERLLPRTFIFSDVTFFLVTSPSQVGLLHVAFRVCVSWVSVSLFSNTPSEHQAFSRDDDISHNIFLFFTTAGYNGLARTARKNMCVNEGAGSSPCSAMNKNREASRNTAWNNSAPS